MITNSGKSSLSRFQAALIVFNYTSRWQRRGEDRLTNSKLLLCSDGIAVNDKNICLKGHTGAFGNSPVMGRHHHHPCQDLARIRSANPVPRRPLALGLPHRERPGMSGLPLSPTRTF